MTRREWLRPDERLVLGMLVVAGWNGMYSAEIIERTGSQSTYGTLMGMERQGWVTSFEEPRPGYPRYPRYRYQVTGDGLRALRTYEVRSFSSRLSFVAALGVTTASYGVGFALTNEWTWPVAHPVLGLSLVFAWAAVFWAWSPRT